jgi:hypothetical protein
MRHWSWSLLLLALVSSQSLAVPFWGAKSSMPADTDPAQLRPGEFIWLGDAVPAGPIVVVSLTGRST